MKIYIAVILMLIISMISGCIDNVKSQNINNEGQYNDINNEEGQYNDSIDNTPNVGNDQYTINQVDRNDQINQEEKDVEDVDL